MNGPEHYAEAERLLQKAPDHLLAGSPADSVSRAQLMIGTAAVRAHLAEVALKFDMATKSDKEHCRYGPEWERCTEPTLR